MSLRSRLALVTVAASAATAAPPALAQAPVPPAPAPVPPPAPQPAPAAPPNPCLDPLQTRLLCPDLRMRPPFGIRVDRRTRPGRALLRAGNSIDSIGRGPVELHGFRDRKKSMRVRQEIKRRGRRPLSVKTEGRFFFKPIPGQYRYWKFTDAARFELWRLDRRNQKVKRVRTGPKVHYCFRDLQRRNPSPRSPSRRVYPACSQRGRERRVTLGTSVGWSDVYPPRYHEQWIDVTGLRGRFAYVHIADPRNHIYELREDNNAAETIVRLPAGRVLSKRRPPDDPATPGPY